MSTLINQYFFHQKIINYFFKIKNLKKIIKMPITEYNALSYDFLEFLYLNEIISNCNSNNNLFYSE